MEPVEYPLKTPLAARVVGCRVSHLGSLIRHGAITAPRKDSSGDFLWTVADVTAAQQALEARRVRKQVAV